MTTHKPLLLHEGKSYEVEITYKRPLTSKLIQVSQSLEVVQVMSKLIGSDRLSLKEFFWVMCLTNSNHILGVSEIGNGTLHSVNVNSREIFQLLLRTNTSKVILLHNHPSGTLRPSEQDIRLTKRIQDMAPLIDAQVIDHVILAQEGYFSFADHNLI